MLPLYSHPGVTDEHNSVTSLSIPLHEREGCVGSAFLYFHVFILANHQSTINDQPNLLLGTNTGLHLCCGDGSNAWPALLQARNLTKYFSWVFVANLVHNVHSSSNRSHMLDIIRQTYSKGKMAFVHLLTKKSKKISERISEVGIHTI